MICKPCAAGADILAGADMTFGEGIVELTPEKRAEIAATGHDRCDGCDCQHGRKRVRVDPGAPGTQLDELAQPATP